MYFRKRAPCISAKEPHVFPQKSPMYFRKRAPCISAQEPYVSPQKSPCICVKKCYVSAQKRPRCPCVRLARGPACALVMCLWLCECTVIVLCCMCARDVSMFMSMIFYVNNMCTLRLSRGPLCALYVPSLCVYVCVN